MDAPLLVRREGAVLVLSNNNPATRNALSPEFYAALTQALADAASDATVGAIVLPLMVFHQMQLMVCAVLAQRYARRPELLAEEDAAVAAPAPAARS